VIVARGDRLDDLWFETWSTPFERGVVYYFNSMVWQVGIFGGLAESLDHESRVAGFQSRGWTSSGFSW
jgi:hypothetical protein